MYVGKLTLDITGRRFSGYMQYLKRRMGNVAASVFAEKLRCICDKR